MQINAKTSVTISFVRIFHRNVRGSINFSREGLIPKVAGFTCRRGGLSSPQYYSSDRYKRRVERCRERNVGSILEGSAGHVEVAVAVRIMSFRQYIHGHVPMRDTFTHRCLRFHSPPYRLVFIPDSLLGCARIAFPL